MIQNDCLFKFFVCCINIYCDILCFSAFEMMQGCGESINVHSLAEVAPELKCLTKDKVLAKRLQIESLYESAIQTQSYQVAEMRREEALIIPKNIDYNATSLSLCFEEREKLMASQPQTVRHVTLDF